jgi:hypothetical protein
MIVMHIFFVLKSGDLTCQYWVPTFQNHHRLYYLGQCGYSLYVAHINTSLPLPRTRHLFNTFNRGFGISVIFSEKENEHENVNLKVY